MMVSLPAARLVPAAVRDAVAVAPEATSVADPREKFPAANITVPLGAAVPLAGLTVALNTADAVWAMPAGLAATVNVVATGGAATVTVIAVDAEAVKLAAPA
jgi:hypothetical protein